MQRSRRSRPCPVPLNSQSITRTHKTRRKPGAAAHWCRHLFLGFRMLSGGRNLKALVRTVLHMWSHLSCSLPSHFLCPPRQLRGGEHYLPPPLTLCAVLPLAAGMLWPHAPTGCPQLSLGHQNDAPSEPGGWKRNAVLSCSQFSCCGVSLCLAPSLD